jgi:hypothetical protein
MTYFGILTCSGCGQKVSLNPLQVIAKDSSYAYFCRRCRKNFDLPLDFVFKQPNGKDLDVETAIKKASVSRGFLSKILDILRLRPF